MTGVADESTATTAVREGYAFDEDALATWMKANVEGYRGPITTVEQFRGGQSNPTYRLSTVDRAYVLRRKSPGKLLKRAHAVERKARVMAALAETGVPVPKVFGICTDETVIGTCSSSWKWWKAASSGMRPSPA